jgi:hypothetical protein
VGWKIATPIKGRIIVKMARSVIRLVGKNVSVELSEYQLNRISNGSTSLFADSGLVAVGVAHSILKGLQNLAPDEFSLSKESPDTPSQRSVQLTGPTEPILLSKMRSLVFKQGTNFITCLYTDTQICFVNNAGHCLYIHRNQIIEPSKFDHV